MASRAPAGGVAPPILFCLACVFLYCGVRFCRARGITLWLRTGGVEHIRGVAGRVLGAVLIVIGCALLAISARLAALP